MPSKANFGLVRGFLAASERFPDRPALEVDGQVVTYAELRRRSSVLAATLVRHGPVEGPPLTAVFGSRSTTTFSGVLAALIRGHGYVPLNPNHPAARTRAVLRQSGARTVVVDATAEGAVDALVLDIEEGLTLVFPESADVSKQAARWPRHRVLGSADLDEALAPVAVSSDSIAYLLFTSGSTGTPKGVMVSHDNATSFVDMMTERYSVSEHDRFSQMFELGFDLCAFDMFVAWGAGACVCCPDRGEVLLPTSYVERAELTVWFSVPSTGVLLKRLGVLEPGAFDRLRLSIFCGEALTADVADAWAKAAPNAMLENLYGPTEVTIACTAYRWDEHTSDAECENGVVPIGEALSGMTALVVDSELREVPPGEPGELLMAGPQVALGYWRDPERTAESFVKPPGANALHYRTGDRVRRPLPGSPMTYLGRMDYQIKVHGQRVELGEVEAVLRKAAGVDAAVAVGWPRTAAGADGIVAFIETAEADVDAILIDAETRLPRYMIPREIRTLPRLPLNSNGKIDRPALLDVLAHDSDS